jgi:ppGpp synthetase/RelA/SpoT-type nucleotidyltranferase
MPPDRQPPEVLLADYDARCALLADLGQVVETALKGLLHAKELKFHSVVHRIKEKSSAERKLTEKGAEYADLGDMHDILGVRIITFFPDEVDRVAQVVTDEFDIDQENSIDKRKTLDPDRFGYLSLHYVAKLGTARMALTEHERFAGLPFEIQIRSILQHAWAEIEHDLGYRMGSSIPSSSRRRFSRLAGLLEIADDEFGAIRDELADYRQQLPEAIKRQPAAVEIDRDSIHALTQENGVVRKLDRRLAKFVEADRAAPLPQNAERYAAALRSVGFTSVEEVVDRLGRDEDLILRFADEWWTGRPRDKIPAGTALLYLSHIEAAKEGSPERMDDYLRKSFGFSDGFATEMVARRIIEAYRRATAG